MASHERAGRGAALTLALVTVRRVVPASLAPLPLAAASTARRLPLSKGTGRREGAGCGAYVRGQDILGSLQLMLTRRIS